MIWFLRIFFILVLAAMLCVTTWASNLVAIWAIPDSVKSDPWFIATLFDAYFGFLTFYIWVAYKETSAIGRAAWLLGILLLGNIAMASYMLWQLFRLPSNARLEALLLRNR